MQNPKVTKWGKVSNLSSRRALSVPSRRLQLSEGTQSSITTILLRFILPVLAMFFGTVCPPAEKLTPFQCAQYMKEKGTM